LQAFQRIIAEIHALLAVVVLTLSGCSERESNGVLELWAAGREGEVVAALTAGFEAEHPGVRVRVQQLPWSGAHEKLLTAVVGEATPDVAQLGNTWIAEFATVGALEPLGARARDSSAIDERDYFEGVWETNRFGGELYGVPWYVDTRLLFYRRDLLANAGFARAPATWSEWLAMLTALRSRMQDGQSPLFLPLNEPEALLAFGVQEEPSLLRDHDRFGNFRSAGFERALAFYVELFAGGLAPKAGSLTIANLWDDFARGNFVFYVSGPWQIGELSRRLPRALAGSWTTAPLPGRDGPGASLAGGSSLVVFERSKKKAAAWQLIEYLSRPAVQQRFYELTGDLPPRRTSFELPALASAEPVRAFRDQLERVVPAPKVPEWERIATQVATVSERAARGITSVDRALVELDERTDRILEKRRWVLARKGHE
jgi:multiple sugar transport system substrate-binding protein